MLRTPRPENEYLRIQKLHEYQILDTSPEQVYDDIVSLAAQICSTPFALITLVDNSREWFKAKKGIVVNENTRNGGFCSQTIRHQDVMIVSDADNDPRFSTNPLVISEPNIRFYAGTPVRAATGEALGSLCVLDTVPRDLSVEQIESLRTLARQVNTILEFRRKEMSLAETIEEAKHTEQLMRTTLEAHKEILNSANISIISTDMQGIIISFNRTAQRMLGYSEEEVVGKYTPLLFHDAGEIAARADKLSKDLGRTIAPGFEAFIAKLNRGSADEREWTYIRKDGSCFPVRLSITTLYGPEGNITGFLKIAIDITDRKEVEARLKNSERFTRAVLDALSKQFCVLDANGNILEVNKPWLDFERAHNGGIQTLEIGQNYPALLDAGLANNRGGEIFAEEIRSVLNGTQPSFSLEYSYHTQSDQPWFVGKVIPFPDQELGRIIVIHENISEHKHLEHRYRHAVESAPNAIVMVNESGTILMVNLQTEASFGYSRTELIGQPVEILVPERFRSAHTGFRLAYLADPTSRPMGAGRELYGLRKDGTEFPVEIGISPIDSDEEKLVLSSIVDITHRKRLEQRFRQAVESAPNAIVLANESGTILMVNVQTETYFGYSRHELIGQPVEKLVPERFRGAHAGFREAYFSAPQSRPMGAGRDLFGLRKDGSEFPVEIGLGVIDDETGTLVLSSIVDITQRKQAEAALKANESALKEAQRFAGLGSWQWDIRTDEHFWSEEIYHIFGRDPALPPAIYPDVQQYFTPDSWAPLAAAVEKGLAEGVPYECDAEVVRPDGAHRWIVARGEATRDAARNVIKLQGTVQDITERKSANDKLKEALSEKEMLLKEVYHRVKNNLQVVSSLINLQARNVKNEATADLLKQSADRIKSMALLHEKLYQSKDLAQIDFNEYSHSLVDHLLFGYSAYPGKIKVSTIIGDVFLDVDTAIPCGLIINELVSNALKHAFPDDRCGEIRISFTKDQGEYILVIADNGTGFPPDQDFKKSTSLGLQLVDTLTRQLMGRMTLDQTDGSTFTIHFPISLKLE